MDLHKDKYAFRAVLDGVSEANKVRSDVLEKDYYVTLLLKELSEKDDQSFAYFKGGTALYKALKSIRRFSEDIDLTVYVSDCPSASQAQKRLENASLKYKSLKKGETRENKRGSITCEYLYDSLFVIDREDELQRFGKVKIEATSFTVSEPICSIIIAPHLYELSNEKTQKTMKDVYGVCPFSVKTISIERIFIDKVFAAQFYFERRDYYDVAKHVYDLTVLLENERIKRFLSDRSEVVRIVSIKRAEEKNRLGGVSADLPVAKFDYFYGLDGNDLFLDAYRRMQKVYVLSEKDRLDVLRVLSTLKKLSSIFVSYEQ